MLAHQRDPERRQQVEAITKKLQQQRRTYTGELDRDQPISWSRCLLSLLSYALFFSDVLRAGLGFRRLPNHITLDTDTVVFFGPYAYPIAHLTASNISTTPSIPYWPYKYDTTSVSMRAVAEHLGISAWSPCLLYKRNCEERSGLPADHIFSMIDSFIQNIRDHTATDRRVRLISLRTKSAFFDRVHDYLLSWFFQHPRIGTTQAIYFDNSQLKEVHHFFCPHGARHLYACDDHWIRFSRACLPSNPYCGGIRTVWTDIQGRLKQLRAMYPKESIDMVIIEGTNDN